MEIPILVRRHIETTLRQIFKMGILILERLDLCIEMAHCCVLLFHLYHSCRCIPHSTGLRPLTMNCRMFTATFTRACFPSLAPSKLRLCSANHRTGYFSNLSCDWLSIVWAYSEQETENRPWFNIALFWWLKARLQYLHCISNKDTAILH